MIADTVVSEEIELNEKYVLNSHKDEKIDNLKPPLLSKALHHSTKICTHIKACNYAQLSSNCLLLKCKSIQFTSYKSRTCIKTCFWMCKHSSGSSHEYWTAVLASVFLSVFGIEAILYKVYRSTVRTFLYVWFNIFVVCSIRSYFFFMQLVNSCTDKRQFNRRKMIQKILCNALIVMCVHLPRLPGSLLFKRP